MNSQKIEEYSTVASLYTQSIEDFEVRRKELEARYIKEKEELKKFQEESYAKTFSEAQSLLSRCAAIGWVMDNLISKSFFWTERGKVREEFDFLRAVYLNFSNIYSIKINDEFVEFRTNPPQSEEAIIRIPSVLLFMSDRDAAKWIRRKIYSYKMRMRFQELEMLRGQMDRLDARFMSTNDYTKRWDELKSTVDSKEKNISKIFRKHGEKMDMKFLQSKGIPTP